MLNVFATNSVVAIVMSAGRGIFVRSAAASPLPVTMPMRAHIDCTAAISGHVTTAVQRSAVPNWAPARE